MSEGLLKSYRFREEREADWAKLDAILKRATNRGARGLTDEEMLALPRLYRQAVSSLSVARSISLDQNVIAYLESLCTRGYFFVYGTRTTVGERLAQFFRHDWPAAIRASVGPTLLAALCFFGGGAIAFFLCISDIEWFWTFNSPGIMDQRTPNASTEYLLSTLYTENTSVQDMLGTFAAFLFSHNAQIAILAFALGFAFGAPTIILLVYNGFSIGAFYALFWSRGLGYEITGWLMIHGTTELFAIVLAGAAGLKIGGAMAFPGRKSRLASARDEGNSAALVAVGAMVMLFVAALLEGFGRQLINSDTMRYVIAGTMLITWLAYFYLPRRKRADP